MEKKRADFQRNAFYRENGMAKRMEKKVEIENKEIEFEKGCTCTQAHKHTNAVAYTTLEKIAQRNEESCE